MKITFYVLAILCAVFLVLFSFDRLIPLAGELLSESQKHNQSAEMLADNSENVLVLVNGEHEYTKQPSSLVSVYDYKNKAYLVKDTNVQLKKQAVLALNDMMADFQKETGLSNINVISGYRSVEAQNKLYRNALLSHGKRYTDKYVQKPGFSEHHSGYAVDFSIYDKTTGETEDFTCQREYRWISENAWRYGFILRYPEDKADITGISYEPWHFRYVGKKAAKYITAHSLCLEEYIENSSI